MQHGFKKLGVMEQQQWAGSETALATAYVKQHFGASIVTYQYSPPTATDQTAELQTLKKDGVQAILSYESPSGTLLEAQEEKTVVYNVPIFDNQCSTATHASLNKLGVTTTCATFVKANSSLPAYQSEIAAAQHFGFGLDRQRRRRRVRQRLYNRRRSGAGGEELRCKLHTCAVQLRSPEHQQLLNRGPHQPHQLLRVAAQHAEHGVSLDAPVGRYPDDRRRDSGGSVASGCHRGGLIASRSDRAHCVERAENAMRR